MLVNISRRIKFPSRVLEQSTGATKFHLQTKAHSRVSDFLYVTRLQLAAAALRVISTRGLNTLRWMDEIEVQDPYRCGVRWLATCRDFSWYFVEDGEWPGGLDAYQSKIYIVYSRQGKRPGNASKIVEPARSKGGLMWLCWWLLVTIVINRSFSSTNSPLPFVPNCANEKVAVFKLRWGYVLRRGQSNFSSYLNVNTSKSFWAQ